MNIIEKVVNELSHPVVKIFAGKAVEKGIKRGIQSAAVAVVTVAVTGDPSLDVAASIGALAAILGGLVEAGRTSLKAMLLRRKGIVSVLGRLL